MIYLAKIFGRAVAGIIVLGLLLALSQSHSNAGVYPRREFAAEVQPPWDF